MASALDMVLGVLLDVIYATSCFFLFFLFKPQHFEHVV